VPPDDTDETLVHHGHVYVQDATRLGMGPGIPVADGKGERIIVSGFHGLHCLVSMIYLRGKQAIRLYLIADRHGCSARYGKR
jgi:hypothetical protein